MIAFRPNTRLDDAAEPREIGEVVDLFLASGDFHPGGDTRRQILRFVTAQNGPIRGVCDAADLDTLITAIRQRLTLATARKDSS